MTRFYFFSLAIFSCLLMSSTHLWGQCAPLVTAQSFNTLCEDDDLSLTATITLPAGCLLGAGTPYIWTGPSAPGPTAGAQIDIFGAAPGLYGVDIAVIQDPTLGVPACPCVGTNTPSNLIEVTPTPATPTAPDVTICAEDSAVLGVTSGAGVYYWYDAAVGGSLLNIGSSYTTPALAAGPVSYYVAEVVNDCESPREEVVVTVTASPADPVVADVDVCPGTPATFTATGVGTINWFDGPLGGAPIATGATYTTPILNQTTIFYVEITGGTGCFSNRVAVTANVVALVASPVANDTSICEGSPATLSAVGTGTTGNEIRWYDVPFGGTPLEVDAFPPATHTYTTPFGLLVTTVYYVAEFDVATGCESARTPITVFVQPPVPEPVGLDVSICEGDAVNLTADYGAGSNNGDLYWYDQATGGTLLQVGQTYTPPASVIATTGVYNFYVEERYNGCTSPTRDEVTVTVNANPAAPTLTGASVCEGSTADLTASGTVGNTLNWYDAPNGNLLFTGTTYTTPALTQTTTYYVQQQNPATSCVSGFVAVSATVLPIPAAPAASDITVCNNTAAVLIASGSGTAGTQLNLYEVATGGVAIATNAMPPAGSTFSLGILATGTYTYYLEEENTTTGCFSARTPVTVTVTTAAVPPTASGTTICSGETTTLTATGTGGTFNWYSDAAATNLLTTGSSFTTPALATTTVYYVTEGSGACESTPTAVTVVVNANPAAPTGTGATVCEGTTATLTATGGGGLLNWYDAPNGNLLGSGLTFTTPSLTQTTVYYVQEVTIGSGCESGFTAVTATVSPTPTPPAVSSISICTNETGTLTATGSGTGSLVWFDVATGGVALQTDAMPPASATFSVGPLPAGVYTYYIEEDNGTCVSTRTSVSVTVTTAPSAPTISVPASICEGETASLIATIVGAGTVNWYDATGTTLLFTGNPYITDPLTTTTTFLASVVNAGCESATTVAVVTVAPAPADPVGTGATVCSGDAATLTATGTVGNILNWYDAPNGTLLTTGTTYTSGALTQSTTFYVQELVPVSGCLSGFVAVTATVTSNPQAPATTDITICEGETGTLTAVGSGAGSLVWYDVSTGGIALETDAMPPATATLSVGPFLAGAYTYYVEEDNGTCVSTRTSITVTVSSLPSAPAVSGQSICAGESATLNATAIGIGTINWYDATGTTLLFSGNPFTTGALATTTSYQVRLENNGCESSATSVTVVVNAAPTDPVIPAATICEGETASLTATGTAGNVINWYADGAGTNLLFTGPTFTTPALTSSTSYYVQELAAGTGCVSNLVAVTVTVLSAPAAPSATDITLCEGATGILTASGSGTGSLVWYDVASGGVALQTDAMPPANATYTAGPFLAGTYTLYVAEDNGSCESVRTPVTITVSSVPTAPALSGQSICEGESATLNATTIGIGTFNWYDATGTTLLFTGNPYNTGTLTATTSYQVRLENNGCESNATSVTVVVNAAPADPTIPTTTICEGETASLTATGTAGNVINWYADGAGTNLLFTGPTFTTPALAATTSYYVQEVAAGTACISNLVPVTVTVLPAPAAPSATDITLCEGTTGTLTASGSGTGSLVWYDVASGGVALQTDAMPPANATYTAGPFLTGTYTLYVAEDNGSCESARTPVTITVTAAPATPVVSGTTICEGETATLSASSGGGTSGIFYWYDATGTNVLFTGSSFTTNPLTVTTTYLVREVVGQCEGPTASVTVVVNPNPAVPAVTPLTICEGNTTTLTASPNSAANLLNWYDDAAGNNLVFTGTSYTTTALNQTTTFWVREFNPATGCASGLVAVTVTVLPGPLAPAAADVTLCENETGSISATGSGTGTLNWYDVASGGAPLQSDAMPPATATFSVGPLPAGTYIYYVEEDNGTCPSARTAVTVTVNAAPAAPSITGIIAICEGQSTTLIATPGSGGLINWYDATGTTLLFTGTAYTTGVLTTTITYQVREESAAGCESAALTVTVTVNPAPADPVATAVTVCSGETATLTATGSGGLINWYDDPAGTNLLATGGSFTTSALTQTTTFWLQELNAGTGCVSNLVPVTVSVIPAAVAPSVGNLIMCEGETGILTATGSGTGTLNWYNVPTGGTPLQSDAMPPVTADFTVGPFTPGTYLFYVEEDNGSCVSARSPALVKVDPAPLAPLAVGTTTCAGSSVILNATSAAATNGIMNWYDATGTTLLYTGANFTTGTLTTTTTFQVRESIGSCESPATTVTVVVNPAPADPAVVPATICEGNTASITAIGPAGTLLTWYDNPNGVNPLFTGSPFVSPILVQTTTYYVQALIPGTGCTSALVPVQVIVLPTPAPPASSNITLCANTTGVLTASGSGTGSLVWYNVPTGGTPLQVNPMPPAAAAFNVGPFPAGTGPYVFYVEEDNGTCTSTRTPISISIVAVPAVPTIPGTTVCEGENATLTAISNSPVPGTFNWYDITGVTLLFTGNNFNTGALSVTTSFLVREENGGCESPAALVTVVVNPAPANPVAMSDTICEGTSATLIATGGTFINWYNDGNGNNLIFTGGIYTTPVLTQSTTYWVQTVTVGTGCVSDLIPVSVTVVPAPAAPSASGISLCEGETGVITASGTGNANTQLNWYDFVSSNTPLQTNTMGPATTTTLSVGPFTPGTYTYYVEEVNTQSGCTSDRIAIAVTVVPQPAQPSINDVAVCAGESITLTAPGTGIFNWYDAPAGGNLLQSGLSYTTPILTTTTSYYVTLEINGCESEREEVVVTVNSIPTAPTITSNSPLCEGDTLLLTATGGAGFGYSWTGPNGFTSTQQNPVIPNVTEADNQGQYTAQVTDFASGCVSATVSLFVDITESPQTPSLSTNSPVCVGDDVILTSNNIAGVTAYIWSRPNGSDTTTTGPELILSNATVLDSGEYAVRVVAGGCPSLEATAVVNVLGGSFAVLAENNGPVCEGLDIELTATAIVGAIYNWTGPNGYTSSSQNPIITSATIADAGDYSVTITVGGCATSAPSITTVLITPSPVVVGILNNGPLCEGEDLELTAPFIAGVTYSWTGPGGFTSTDQSPVIVSVNENDHQGDYSLIVTDTVSGCSSIPVTTTVFIDDQGSLVIITSNDGPVCEGSDVQLNVSVSGGTPPYSFMWMGPINFTSTVQNPLIANITPDGAGVYSVLVDGQAGACSASGSANSTIVEVNLGLPVDAGADQTITEGDGAQLLATGAFVYTWDPITYLDNPSIANPIATPPVGTFTYTVTGVDLNGCEGVDTVNVTVEPQTGQVGVYDLFTPNGDGVNDFWVVEFINNFTNYQLVVFDRGGIEVLNTTNYQNDWDGTYRGRDLPEGTYWYVIRTPEQEFKGAITLIR